MSLIVWFWAICSNECGSLLPPTIVDAKLIFFSASPRLQMNLIYDKSNKIHSIFSTRLQMNLIYDKSNKIHSILSTASFSYVNYIVIIVIILTKDCSYKEMSGFLFTFTHLHYIQGCQLHQKITRLLWLYIAAVCYWV